MRNSLSARLEVVGYGAYIEIEKTEIFKLSRLALKLSAGFLEHGYCFKVLSHKFHLLNWLKFNQDNDVLDLSSLTTENICITSVKWALTEPLGFWYWT